VTLPVLYSFRRCPYAMRARLALVYAGQQVLLREIELKNKPVAMLSISPKGTVPVLHLSDGSVLEESLDIMLWALQQSDPQGLLSCADFSLMQKLVEENDSNFKYWLDRYKYFDRYPEMNQLAYREKGEAFLLHLDELLQKNKYLLSEQISFADIAIMPFVRQFAHVDKNWFDHCDYEALRNWLDKGLGSESFVKVMEKYPPWDEGGMDEGDMKEAGNEKEKQNEIIFN